MRSLLLVPLAVGATANGVCDIFAAGKTPCVAAHSTTRALYEEYQGALYQVRRSSDNATADIGVSTAGGVANSATQDAFCDNDCASPVSFVLHRSRGYSVEELRYNFDDLRPKSPGESSVSGAGPARLYRS